MRKHHSRHWAMRATAGLTGAAAGVMTLSYSDSLTANAAGSAPFWLAHPDGHVSAENGAPDLGSLASTPSWPVVTILPTPDHRGYWLAEANGNVQAFGDARAYGQLTGPLNAPIVGLADTPDGHGYWLVASDGGIFSYGDARFFGSAGNIHLESPIVGMAATPDGQGYWLVASDGGIFTYGDAFFRGSAANMALSSPITGMAATSTGHGYWLVAADGGVFTYGDARFSGSGVNSPAFSGGVPVTELLATADSGGYRLVDGHGDVESFGDAAGAPHRRPFGVAEQSGSPPSAPSPLARRAERFAESQVGRPYAYGGTGPSAYDCSGLVYRSFAEAGVALPRTAAQQYGAGSHVPVSQAVPGDLVFWASNDSNPQSIYHVGIYVGGGDVVNATRPGGTVQVMAMSELGPAYPEATRV